LPTGASDVLGRGCVKGFCPRCCDLYDTPSTLDGASWGTTFPHLFTQQNIRERWGPFDHKGKFQPRVFGFRLRGPEERHY